MHDDDDDTVPQAVLTALAERDDTIAVDVIDGDTILRDTRSDVARVGLPPVPAVLLPRHRIRVGGGELIDIDQPIQFGRRPTPARVPGTVPARLVTVPSPEGGISANHLEIRQDGHVVTVRDLRTLNGSTVHLPGAEGRPLTGGASLVVVPGTVVDLGEGVLVEVFAPAGAPGART